MKFEKNINWPYDVQDCKMKFAKQIGSYRLYSFFCYFKILILWDLLKNSKSLP